MNISRKSGAGRLAPLAAVLLPAAITLGAFAYAPSASAAPKHNAPVASATLSVPSSVSPGVTFSVSGTGYNPTEQAWMYYSSPTANGVESAGPDASGDVSASFTFGVAGTIKFWVVQGGSTVSAASTTVS